MIVRISSTHDDASAQEIYNRFIDEGTCPFGSDNYTLGLVKDAKEGPVGYVFSVEIDAPAPIRAT